MPGKYYKVKAPLPPEVHANEAHPTPELQKNSNVRMGKYEREDAEKLQNLRHSLEKTAQTTVLINTPNRSRIVMKNETKKLSENFLTNIDAVTVFAHYSAHSTTSLHI